MTDSYFISPEIKSNIIHFQTKVSAPSNIALVKYWGKVEQVDASGNISPQIPANPSISFTLNNCKTITLVDFDLKNSDSISFDFFFEGKEKPSFNPKIEKFLNLILPYCSYLRNYHLKIDTQNTFPHSSGIASSASGMAALARAIVDFESKLNPDLEEHYLLQKASFLARLGSGSACRSLKGKIVVWGKHRDFEQSSNLLGVEFSENIHQNFNNYQDTILLVDKGEKTVSSTVGHNLMHNHPFAEKRFEQAHENLSILKMVLQNGDLNKFIEIVESEALTLHAMMMTSIPYFILMKSNTLAIINEIWKFRAETQIPVCFTLDAGANVHVLYPENVTEAVLGFIKEKLVAYCQNEHYICDQIGEGSIIL
jgi:diphosphomevalonate decarboxylase